MSMGLATKQDKRLISEFLSQLHWIKAHNTHQKEGWWSGFSFFIFLGGKNYSSRLFFFLLVCGCQDIAASSAPHVIWFCSCFPHTVTKKQSFHKCKVPLCFVLHSKVVWRKWKTLFCRRDRFSLLTLSVHTPAPVFPHPMTPTCGGTPK